VYLVSTQCYESKAQTCKGQKRLHIVDRYTHFMRKFPVIEIFEMKRLWPRFMMVQRQPGSGHGASRWRFLNDPIVVPFTSLETMCQILMTLNYEGSRSSVVEVHSTNRKPIVCFLSDILWVQHHISRHFRDIELKLLRPGSRTVEGQPRSKIMVPIDSVWVDSFLFDFH